MTPADAVLSATDALRLIADAGEVLASSLDYQETLRRVARLAVPHLADWCAVYISGAGEEEQELTSGHPDREVEAMLLAVRARRRRRGASESQAVARSTAPVLAPDVRGAPGEEIEPGQRPLFERLGAKSYMLVPLLARGRSLGALTLLSTREGRHYTAADLALAQTLAERCAMAIDNARLHDAAERSLSLLDTVFATAPVGLAFLDTDLRFVRLNEAMAAFNQRPVEAHIGRTLLDVLGEPAAELRLLYERVLTTGEPVRDHLISGATAVTPTEIRHFNLFATPVHGPGGELLGVSAVVLDVTDRQRLFEAERAARVRADFLARAGALLDETLDYASTLRAVAEIAVPEVADWCAVDVLDDRGRLERVAAAHVDPAERRLGDELQRRFPPDRAASSGTMQVARSGATEFVPEITEEMLVAGIPDPEQLALVRRLRLRSMIIAPLRARGRVFGTLTLANTTGSRPFSPADVQLAEELARRAGIAIDNAHLYTERSHIAHTLQAKLLPDHLPVVPGLRLAARYRAAGELNEVGGDFYDIFARASGEWAVVVGDVSGKGAEAAAVTAVARYTLRAGVVEDDTPTSALRRLNSALRGLDHGDQFTTAALAYVALTDDDALTVRLALAGHPPAMIVRRDGAVEPAGRFGSMLALSDEPEFQETRHRLSRSDVLVLYTDGVTEAGPRTHPFGDAAFPALLSELAGRDPQTIVDAVEQAVLDLQGGRPRDDLALFALALAADG